MMTQLIRIIAITLALSVTGTISLAQDTEPATEKRRAL